MNCKWCTKEVTLENIGFIEKDYLVCKDCLVYEFGSTDERWMLV